MTVSVITVTYNSASTIADTMQSVLHQTYEDIEYLIIDGGSTDGTQGIIEEFEPKFLREIEVDIRKGFRYL
jgi:glycosyltransferase involved in cell wall biosynthesis